MNQKQIGIILLIVGILVLTLVYLVNEKEKNYIERFQSETGTCFLDGTCLYEERDYTPFILGGVIAIALIILGVYLIYFDKTQKILIENQQKITETLKEVKQDEKFNAYISSFNEDEQKILKAIKEQDGIKQDTLRYKTGIPKTALSLMLKSLEERKIITKKPFGKTNQIFLRNKF